jgi:hypothetical protein
MSNNVDENFSDMNDDDIIEKIKQEVEMIIYTLNN